MPFITVFLLKKADRNNDNAKVEKNINIEIYIIDNRAFFWYKANTWKKAVKEDIA